MNEVPVDTARKSLLVRADFTLDRSRGGSRLAFKRWRRVLAEALPRLLGLGDRCSRVRLRLHEGEEEGRYSLWLHLPAVRHPGRKRLARLKARLLERLESVLLPVGGEIVRLSVRKCQPKTVLCLTQSGTVFLPFTANESVGQFI